MGRGLVDHQVAVEAERRNDTVDVGQERAADEREPGTGTEPAPRVE